MVPDELLAVGARARMRGRAWRASIPLLDAADESAGVLQGVLLATGLGALLWTAVVVVLLAATA